MNQIPSAHQYTQSTSDRSRWVQRACSVCHASVNLWIVEGDSPASEPKNPPKAGARVENWLSLDELIEFLLEIGQLSEAAADYGRILRITDPLPDEVQEIAIEFWEASLNAETDPDQYKGFGWWSETGLPDEVWLTLIQRTLHRSGGGIDWLDGLIERLTRLSLDVRALEALEMALSGVDKDDPWAVRLAERQIIAALETARREHGESEVFQRIVELLLEREMYQFRQFLINGDSAED